jgi:hypothetical protein
MKIAQMALLVSGMVSKTKWNIDPQSIRGGEITPSQFENYEYYLFLKAIIK